MRLLRVPYPDPTPFIFKQIKNLLKIIFQN